MGSRGPDTSESKPTITVGELVVGGQGTGVLVHQAQTVNVTVHQAVGRAAARTRAVEQAPDYVFVAHASADKLLVMRLCRSLLAHGVRPWLDVWDLPEPTRHRWEAKLGEVLSEAPVVIVCEGPRGCGLGEPHYGERLQARIEAKRDTVLWVRLPGARSNDSVSAGFDEAIELDESNWTAGVESLAAQIGISKDRARWRALEARSLGVAEGELSPYRGLASFRERDARWMFGRDEEIANLLALAERQALLTVIGSSGSGKSSLVMAGLCPALRHGALGERVTKIAYLRPGAKPCEELAHALVSLSPPADPASEATAVVDLREHLLRSNDMLKLFVRRMAAAEANGHSTRRIVLVVDQLEELFTEARLGHDDESPEAMAFVRNLVEATSLDASDDAPAWIVSTLRADFLPHCLAVAELARTLNSGVYMALPPMREEQVREAVELPARRVGFELPPPLVEKLVSGAAEQAGRLPLLQHVLQELWHHRDEPTRTLTLAAYKQTGGLEGAIAAAAERTLAGLRERMGERAAAVTQRVMMRLVHIGEGTQGDTRRRATLDELGRDDETRQVLDAFVHTARVLFSDDVGGVAVIEIAHEALLREWATLVGWLDANRGALRLQQELAQEAAKFAKQRDAEYLWGRGRIDEARRVLGSSTVELRDAEREFLAASAKAVRARSLRVWGAVSAVFVVLLGLATFALARDRESRQWAAESERQAEENTALATAEHEARLMAEKRWAEQKGLLATWLSVAGGSYIEAAILAIEAMAAGDVRRPAQTVYEGLVSVLSAAPAFERAVLVGHSSDVQSLAFSLDGTRLVSASEEGARSWDVASGESVGVFEDRVIHVAVSPDGLRLVTIDRSEVVRLLDAESGRLEVTLDESGEVFDAAFSPDGTRLATAGRDGARVWEIASGQLLATCVGHSDLVMGVAFSPDGARLATAGWDGTARLWDAESCQPLATLEGHEGQVNKVAFSPDGLQLATTSFDTTAGLWDVETGRPLAFLKGGHSAIVRGVAFSPDGARLATAGWDGARLWDTSGQLLANFAGHRGRVHDVAFSPDGNHLATGSADRTVRLWDVAPSRPLVTLGGHTGAVHAIAFSPDGTRIVSTDNTLRSWDVASGSLLTTFEDHRETARDIAFSPAGDRLASASGDIARLWDPASGRSLAVMSEHVGVVTAVAFSPDGTRLATASWDHTARIWSGDSGQAAVLKHTAGVKDVVFSPDGARVATASEDQTARLWDAASGELLSTLEGHTDTVARVVFSPDGARMATASEDHSARLWDVATGSLLFTLESHTNALVDVAFSPDGTRLATASEDHSAVLWEVASGRRLAVLEGHSQPLTRLAFSPDGAYLATAGDDASVRLWDGISGQALATLRNHDARINALTFSPDGTRLASASDDKTVILWPMPELALELLCRRIRPATRYPEVAQICDPLVDN